MLEIDGVCKDWGGGGGEGGFAHGDVSFTVREGELFVLLGPSGAGKSLLLEMVAGFDAPDEGTIRIAGVDVTRAPPEARNVGMVYQDLMLFPNMTVAENIAYGLKARGVSGGEISLRVARFAGMLDIHNLLERRPMILSSGQKQRVALARALAIEPAVLLLDEPFSSVDAPLERILWRELKDLHRETKTTMLLVTHDRAQALALGRHIGIIRDGRIEQVGAASDVFERPLTRFVAEFTGATNILRGSARAGTMGLSEFSTDALRLQSTGEATGRCLGVIRPENITVSSQAGEANADNVVEGVVETLTRHGLVFEVTGRFGGVPLTSVVTPQTLRQLALAPGRRIVFSFEAQSVHTLSDDSSPAASDGDVSLG